MIFQIFYDLVCYFINFKCVIKSNMAALMGNLHTDYVEQLYLTNPGIGLLLQVTYHIKYLIKNITFYLSDAGHISELIRSFTAISGLSS